MNDAYPIPAEALDDRLAFVGTAGSGKTYSAGTAVERLLSISARVVIVDPLDVWWGLRLAADGEKASRFKIVIFGGAHGDLPLNEHAGALLGETVATMAESCIVSLGGMATKASERRFMLAFLDALYRKTSGAPVHLVCDEADMWAPQKPNDKDGFSAPLLGQMEAIVRRGRIKGFVPWLITQRPAVLNKDVLSQADGLIALKLTASQDRAAIGAWIEGMADREQGREILGSLPAMQRGQGVVWIPARGVLATSAFPLKATYDSSRTPKRGEIIRSAALQPLDLGALKEKLATVEAETKANDPKALKAEIAALKRDLAKATDIRNAHAAPDPVALQRAETVAYQRGFEEGEQRGRAAGNLAGQTAMLARAQNAVDALLVEEAPQDQPMPRVPVRAAPAPARTIREATPARAGVQRQEGAALDTLESREAPALTGPQRRILDALAWWRAFGIESPTNEQVAFIAGYSPTSTSYTNPRGALSAGALVRYPRPNCVCLTADGAAAAQEPEFAPDAAALRTRVLEKLSGPGRRILEPVLRAYPDALTNAEAAEAAGYSPTSTSYTNPRGALSSLSVITYPSPGQVRAADWLFP